MSLETDIVNKVREALKESCDDAFDFSDDEKILINAEYLLVVNTAKAIKKLNYSFGTPYKIFPEHNTEKFATACTPLFKKGVLRAGKNNTNRPGKNRYCYI